MNKYHVTYRSSTDHDCCTVWTNAHSKQDAIAQVENEYWDVESIIDVIEEKSKTNNDLNQLLM